MKNENIVHVVEEYDIPRYEVRVRDDYKNLKKWKEEARK